MAVSNLCIGDEMQFLKLGKNREDLVLKPDTEPGHEVCDSTNPLAGANDVRSPVNAETVSYTHLAVYKRQ